MVEIKRRQTIERGRRCNHHLLAFFFWGGGRGEEGDRFSHIGMSVSVLSVYGMSGPTYECRERERRNKEKERERERHTEIEKVKRGR